MSLMPNPGSLVRLTDGRVGIVTRVTPNGSGDRVWVGSDEVRVNAWDIEEIIHEPEWDAVRARPQPADGCCFPGRNGEHVSGISRMRVTTRQLVEKVRALQGREIAWPDLDDQADVLVPVVFMGEERAAAFPSECGAGDALSGQEAQPARPATGRTGEAPGTDSQP